MNVSAQQLIEGLLSQAVSLEAKTDSLTLESSKELYSSLGEAARFAAANIKDIDPELRVRLCELQDKVLEHVVDHLPPAYFKKPRAGVYTPAVERFRRWYNAELLKDKGLAGYLLARETGARPVMLFGTQPEDYPYLSVLPEMKLEYLDDSADFQTSMSAYFDHLELNYKDMDTLILHGMYPQTIPYLIAYRALRPDGKVYCGLDMNSEWMKRISWGDNSKADFAKNCDVVATSCRTLRDALNRRPDVSFACRFMPNGFYKPDGARLVADVEQKRNIILTVGRIGSKQKRSEELMIAFARASGALPGWSLRLVGKIEPELQPFLESYFSRRPDIKNRVVLTGPIQDKAELYREYARAKIFALTSLFEGGAPNVYAEALFHGCMFVTSDIDAADDITNYGELGRKYRLGDFNELAARLVELCSASDKRAFMLHIPKALSYAAKYYDWKRNAKKLAFMLYNQGG